MVERSAPAASARLAASRGAGKVAARGQLRDGRHRVGRGADRRTDAGSECIGAAGARVVVVDGGDAGECRCVCRRSAFARGGAMGCPFRADGRASLSAGRNIVCAGFHGDRNRAAPARHGCAGMDRLRGRGFRVAARSLRACHALGGSSRMTGLLRVTKVRVAYGDVCVLDGIDLDIARGEFVALIGPNGAGKTTLLHAIAGIAPLRIGNIDIDGHDLASAPRAAKQAIGLAIDPPNLPVLLTGRECLALFAGARGLPAIPPATLALGETLSLTSVLDRRIASCSLGMRQKLGIMLGLLGEPPLLLLDEPFNGLDPRSALAFESHLAAILARGGTSVLLATH